MSTYTALRKGKKEKAPEAYVKPETPRYDFTKDPVYRQYSQDYAQQHKELMANTQAVTSALAGGYGNSYARSVAQQTNKAGPQAIAPALIQLARQREQQEQADSRLRYMALANWEEREHTRKQDALANQQRQAALEYERRRNLRTESPESSGTNTRQHTQYSQKTQAIPQYTDYLAMMQNLQARSRPTSTKAAPKPKATASTDTEYDNGGISEGNVRVMERMLGLADDGKWTAEDARSAGGMTAEQAYGRYQRGQLQNYKSVGVVGEKETVQSWAEKAKNLVGDIQQYYSTWSGGEAAMRQHGSYWAKATALLSDGRTWRETYQDNPDALAAIDEINKNLETAIQYTQQKREYYDLQETAQTLLGQQISNAEGELDTMARLLWEYKDLTRWEQSEQNPTRLGQIRKKYPTITDLEDAIAEKKALLQELRANQSVIGWQMQYEGQSYRELRKTMKALPEGSEKTWLKGYADSIATKEDYQEELKDTDWTLGRLNKLLSEYRELTRWEQDAAGRQRIQSIAKNYGSVSDLQDTIRELMVRKQTLENTLKYNYLWENEDYEALSQYDGKASGWDAVQYHRANDVETAKFDETLQGIGQVLGNPYSWLPDGYYDNTHLMTEDERKNYNYLHAREGMQAADAYMEYLAPTLNQRYQDELAGVVSTAATYAPITTSMLSTPVVLLSGLGTLDVASQHLAQAITGKTAPIDYNRDAMSFATIGSTIRGTVSQNIVDATGVLHFNEESHPVLSKIFNGRSLADVYQLGMSMQDSGAVTAMSAVHPALGHLGSALLGGSASTQAMLDAVQRGASDKEALAVGLLAGAFELLFEEIKLGSLFNVGDDMAAKMIREVFTEGLGEGLTTFANTVADAYITADHSQLAENIRRYQQEHPDWSRERAAREALLDMAVQVGWDGVFGMISGAISGSTVSTVMDNFDWQQSGEPQTSSGETVDTLSKWDYEEGLQNQTTYRREPEVKYPNTQKQPVQTGEQLTATPQSTPETLTQSTKSNRQAAITNQQNISRTTGQDTASLPGQNSIRDTLRSLPEGAIQTDREARVLSNYRQTLDKLQAQQRELERINAQITTLTAKQTPQNSKQLHALQAKAEQLRTKIAAYEAALQQTENSDVVQGLLKRANEKHEYTKIPFEKQSPYDIISVKASKLPNRFKAFIPSKARRLEIIREGIALEKPIFADGLLGKLAPGITPKPDYYDVVLHGRPYWVEYFGERIDVETLCAIIAQRKDYQKGMNIRLISCNTGEKADGVAQYIADKLHVKVLAPDKKAIVNRTVTGRTIVYSGSEPGKRDGRFILFEPKEGEE